MFLPGWSLLVEVILATLVPLGVKYSTADIFGTVNEFQSPFKKLGSFVALSRN
jgi:hypothetical protein